MDFRSSGRTPLQPALRRQGSFTSITSRSLKSTRSARSSRLSSAEEAVLISQASSQATTAAKSILMAGGNHGTALLTAKAAAQAVLRPTETSTGPVLSRRKAKRQAEVIASMALVSAANNLASDLVSAREQESDVEKLNSNHQNALQIRSPQFSHAPSTHQSVTFEESPGTHSEATKEQDQIHATSQNGNREQRLQTMWSNAPNDTRMATETQHQGQIRNDSRSPRSPRVLGDYFKKRAQLEEDGRGVATKGKNGNSPHRVQQKTKIPAKMPLNKSRTNDLLAKIPSADPIYEAPRPTSPYSTCGDSSYSEATDDDEESHDGSSVELETYGSSIHPDEGFMQTAVDPFLTSLTNTFSCGPQDASQKSLFDCGSTSGVPACGCGPQPSAKKRLPSILKKVPKSSKPESRDDKDDIQVTPPATGSGRSRSRVCVTVTAGGNTTAASEEKETPFSDKLFQELLNEDVPETEQPKDDDTASIRECMEQIVLGPLAVGSSSPKSVKSKSSNVSTDKISRSRYNRAEEIFSGVQRNPSADKAEKSVQPHGNCETGALQDQKGTSRIRRWMRRVKPKTGKANE